MFRVDLNTTLDTSSIITSACISRHEINSNLKPLKGYTFNYILGSGDEIIYIGYSNNIYHRLTQHKSSRQFDRVILIEFDDEPTARSFEKQLILEYRPKLNNQYL